MANWAYPGQQDSITFDSYFLQIQYYCRWCPPWFWLLIAANTGIYSSHRIHHSLESKHLDLELKIRVGRDGPDCSLPVGSCRWAYDIHFVADGQMRYDLVPASDNLVLPDSKRERSSSVPTGVEFSSIKKCASVVDFNFWAEGRIRVRCSVLEVLYRVFVDKWLGHPGVSDGCDEKAEQSELH